jgi:predicted nucleotidyltransferase
MPGHPREHLIATLQRELAAPPAGLAVAWLFGSVARGTMRLDSDVDVGVLYRDPPPGTLDAAPLELEGQLERAVRREVQLVVMNGAPPDLVHRILRDGVLLAEPDRRARIAFEVRARNEYFDLLPHLQRYRRRA